MSIATISNHDEQAKNRLITQFRSKPNIDAFLGVYTTEVQGLETIYFQLLENRSIDASVGTQLDLIGTILNETREGLSDSDYRLKLIAKIAANISQGTPEDMINIYKILMQADQVELFEYFPGTIQLFASNTEPISAIQRIKDALNRTKASGVVIDSLVVINTPPFGFAEVSDLNSKGFRDLNELLETIVPFEMRDLENSLTISSTPFAFSEDTDQNGKGYRDINDLEAGGAFASINEIDTSESHFDDVNSPGIGRDLSAIVETDQSETVSPDSGFFSSIL